MPNLALCVVDIATVLPGVRRLVRGLALGPNNGLCGAPIAKTGKRRIARNDVFRVQHKSGLKVGFLPHLRRNRFYSSGFPDAWRDTPLELVAFKASRDFSCLRQRKFVPGVSLHFSWKVT